MLKSARNAHRARRAGGVAASAAALIGVGLLGPAVAAASAAQAAPGQPATIRVAHLSPDMPGVDITITSFNGTVTSYLDDAKYGDVGKYKQVPAGSYTFSIRRHGAAATSPALQTWSVTAQPGYAYTAAEIGTGSTHRGVVFNDNLTPPKSGYGNVRLIQAASRAGDADVATQNGPVVARGAAFGTSTKYAAVKAGTWRLQATGGGNTTDRDVSIRAGSVTTVFLLDAPEHGIRVIDSVDAAAAAKTPTGSVDAGGGGLAGSHQAQPSGGGLRDALLGALAAVVLAGAGVAGRRRAAARPS
ncbi:DUF4397 domain-containing protein [uncultured Jatrophihabitans sp.]|uniref:DUF4397 domain-containing protein n=1 Tax=uncultured Jatrophihabitans sp. TaxID=1610747 RepID=UPI0035CC2298